MTNDQARAYRWTYGLLGGGAAIIGTPTLVLSVLKIGYEFNHQPGQPTPIVDPFGGILRVLFGIIPGTLNWVWPWLSDYGVFGWPFSLVLAPTALLGLVLVFIAAFSSGEVRKLTKWISEVKELLHKEEMAASRRPPSPKQSVENVAAGRDAIINLNNHYNHRPDNPKTPIVVAVIGAIAVMVAALIGLLRHS